MNSVRMLPERVGAPKYGGENQWSGWGSLLASPYPKGFVASYSPEWSSHVGTKYHGQAG